MMVTKQELIQKSVILRITFLGQLLFLLVFLHPSYAYFHLSLDSEPLVPEEQSVLENFLRDVETHLPPLLKESIPSSLYVQFVHHLDSSKELQIPNYCVSTNKEESKESSRQVLGKVRKTWFSATDHIWINDLLKAEILKGSKDSRSFSCGHKNFYQLALATVLHEIVHIYDELNVMSEEEKAALIKCQNLVSWYDHQGYVNTSWEGKDACLELIRRRRTVSENEQYLNLGGWLKTGFFYVTRAQTNRYRFLNSPDPYEYENPEEHFAVNMEYFLLDPEYASRRPALNLFFKEHFHFDPFPLQPSLNTKVELTSTDPFRSSHIHEASLDPDRVYEIHYLLAGKGETMSSRWGHAMYRLVVCDPQRMVVGPECLNDVSYHVVLSYRANVMDLIIHYWKGLTGQYPSQLFLYPFLEIVDEYTKDELRDLKSIPLKLSDVQKKIFIYQTLQNYWNYTGDYYFLGNNCAVESLNAIKCALSDLTLQNTYACSPCGVLTELSNCQLCDDPKTSLFHSERENLNKAFSNILPLSFSNIEDFLDHSDASVRRQLFDQKVNLSQQKKILAATFSYLEAYILRRYQHLYLQKMASLILRVMEGEDVSPDASESVLKIKKMMDLQQKLLLQKRMAHGYGLPLSGFTLSEQPELQTMAQDVLLWSHTHFSKEWAEIQRMKENSQYFRAALIHQN